MIFELFAWQSLAQSSLYLLRLDGAEPRVAAVL